MVSKEAQAQMRRVTTAFPLSPNGKFVLNGLHAHAFSSAQNLIQRTSIQCHLMVPSEHVNPLTRIFKVPNRAEAFGDQSLFIIPSVSGDQSLFIVPSVSGDQSFFIVPSVSDDQSFFIIPSVSGDQSFFIVPSVVQDGETSGKSRHSVRGFTLTFLQASF